MSAAPHPFSRLSRDRLDSVDALRGIAALYVLVFHLALIPNPGLAVPHWASPFVLTGDTGVALFFIVSAFCLCLSMRQHTQEPRPTLRFFIRRVFRIAPLFYVWLIVSWCRDRFLLGVTHHWGEMLLNVFFGFNFVPGRNEGFVWASWTLGVEMVFYLLFPIFFHYFNNWWKSLGFFFFTLLVAAGFANLVTYFPIADSHRASFLDFSFFRQLPVFAFGMAVFFVFERFIQDNFRASVWAFVLVGIAVLWYSAMVGVDPFGYGNLLPGRFKSLLYSYYLRGVIYGILLLGLSIAPLWLFVNRLTRFYGEISYSVYLNHPTVVFGLIPVYRSIYALHWHPTFQYGACLLLTLALLTALSYCTYRFIEQPGIRLGKRLIRKVAPVVTGPA